MTLLTLLVVIILLCFGAFKAALIVFIAALAIDILILLLRVGARATLAEGEFSLRVIAGPIRLKLLPRIEPEKAKEEEPGEDGAKKPKKGRKPKKKKRPKKGEETQAPGDEEKKKPGIDITLELISTVLSAVGEMLGRLRRKISIDKLTIHYTVASDGPYSAAMTFGYACAGVNALMPVIENIFKVKERDVGVDATFDSDKSEFFIDAQLTIAIWEIIYIALAVWPVVKAVIAQYLKNRKVDKNGQASDQ